LSVPDRILNPPTRKAAQLQILFCPRCNFTKFTIEGPEGKEYYICGNPVCQAQIVVTARIIGYGKKGNDRVIQYGPNLSLR
jgi:hypothetical protein